MISVTILTKNSALYLQKVLQGLHLFPEVLIYDTGSQDESLQIAAQFPNVTIHKEEFIGFGPTHNKAAELATNDWILSIDSDELVTEPLAHEILNLNLDAKTVYGFPRHNEFNGKWIRWCGWYPDRQIRLYHRKETCFSEAQVHEAVKAEGMSVHYLKAPVIHYSYRNISDFLNKMQSYSELFAKQNQGKRKSSPLIAINHSVFAFFKSYFLKKGFLGGYEGFLISIYNAHTAFYKYLKLYEANQNYKHKL